MEPGTRISHYDIAEKLGQGGMGVVYKAWDHKLRRMVALKFLPAPAAGDGAQAARFHQEALAVSALNHPNIATIYDIEEADGHPFLALEYLPGGTLQSALEQLRSAGQQISLQQGLAYAIQIAEALAHAHRNGVIHRDVKTANVMFAQSGAVKLTDFGLAKTAESSGVTRTGTVMGTPATMSPEQARGLKTDERSDIFSAGAVLFELFTGRLPFQGDNPAAVLYQVVHEEAPALSRFRPGIPPALEQIVSKALKKDPAERYQTAAGLASDLRALHRELLTGSSATDHAARRGDLETVVIAAGGGMSEERSGRGATSGASNGARGWRRICAHRSIFTGASLVAIAAVALGLWWAWPEPETRLAILPFENLGADASDQALADGFREALIGQLAGLERPRGLLVVDVSKSQVDSREIGEPSDARSRLGANLVMTGKLIRTGPKPQLVVRLEDPQSLEERGAQTIDVESGDFSAATSNVVRMLKVGIGARLRLAREPGGSSNPQATRLYIEGRGHLQHDGGLMHADDLDAAAQAFREAITQDTRYALAWSGLAYTLSKKSHLDHDSALLEEARQDALRALALDNRSAYAHIAMAQVSLEGGAREAAERELRAALKIEPENAKAYRLLGDSYEARGDYKSAEATYQDAIRMRPGDADGYNHLGAFYYRRNRPDLLPKAERQFLNAIALARYNYKAHNNLAAVYFKLEHYRDAIEHLKTSLSIAPSPNGHNNLGTVYYYTGLYDEAAAEFRNAAEGASSNYMYWGNLADAHRWAGREDEAAVNYRKAIDLLKADPHVNPALQHATLAMYHASTRHHGALAAEDREQARKEIETAAKLESHEPDPPHAEIGFRKVLVYAQTGDLDQAFDALAKLLQTAPAKLQEIEKSPALKEFRKDRRFSRVAGFEDNSKSGGNN
jgi:eukaryotic-like serine/threonine-protein kinase